MDSKKNTSICMATFLQNDSFLRACSRQATEYTPFWLMRQAGPAHIFNLGHGIHQNTPPEHVTALIEAVHKHSSR